MGTRIMDDSDAESVDHDSNTTEGSPPWEIWDLFSGIGGFSLGAIDAMVSKGVKSVVLHSVECDAAVAAAGKRALESYAKRVGLKNFTVHKHVVEIGKDPIDWPNEHERLIIHMSPPCIAFSRARAGKDSKLKTLADEKLDSARLVKFCLDKVVERGYRRFTLENVDVAETRKLVNSYHELHPSIFGKAADCAFNARAWGCPSDRRRLFVTSPVIARALRQQCPCTTVSVEDAFKTHGLTPRSNYVSNGNKTAGVVDKRAVSCTAFTVTSSHPPLFVEADGSTVECGCFTPEESACVLGFPKGVALPTNRREAQRAVGNAVSPLIARAVAEVELSLPTKVENTPVATPAQTLEELMTRVSELEKAVAGLKRGRGDDGGGP